MRAVRDDPSDPSKVRRREVARQRTTELDRARRLDLQLPGIRLAGRHSKILAPAHQQAPGCRILATHFWETAFPHRKNRSPAFRQRDNCRCQKISAITTRRHLQTKAFERSRTESRMQSKCDMRGQRILGGRKSFVIRYFNEALSSTVDPAKCHVLERRKLCVPPLISRHRYDLLPFLSRCR